MRWRVGEFLQEPDGRFSSRRFVGLLCALALVLALTNNQTNEALIWAVTMLAGTGLGLTTWEGIVKAKQDGAAAVARASGAGRAVSDA